MMCYQIKKASFCVLKENKKEKKQENQQQEKEVCEDEEKG